ncbi:hypothetical protein G6L37_04340 [Agrobacterium rubi]|nr:hypothetical protein [Agrobacterium rubi]NTF24581.1 hypothetical protein [Agrobacterium rubi]
MSAMIAAFAILVPSAAVCLDAPREKVVLTIRGAGVANPNVGDTAQFDLPMLEALAGRKASMDTPWFKEKTTFSGPFLRSVLEAAGATGSEMTISALNDYSYVVPFSDAKMDAILATRLDGKIMSVRDKGPLFLVYPFDLRPDLATEKYFNRSVWQIVNIEVR